MYLLIFMTHFPGLRQPCLLTDYICILPFVFVTHPYCLTVKTHTTHVCVIIVLSGLISLSKISVLTITFHFQRLAYLPWMLFCIIWVEGATVVMTEAVYRIITSNVFSFLFSFVYFKGFLNIFLQLDFKKIILLYKAAECVIISESPYLIF